MPFSWKSFPDLLFIQRAWSRETFGPGPRVNMVLDHMLKEIEEVRDEPRKLEEWIDLLMLAFDGALRQGFSPQEILEAYHDKLLKNKTRKWPDWRTVDPEKAIEHSREEEKSD